MHTRQTDATPLAGARPDAESAAWVRALRDGGPARDAALARLHPWLVAVARGEARRRAVHSALLGSELEDIVQQAADDALLAITRKIDDFRGDSRFTTWAAKFALLEVASKVTRHAWRRTGPPREPPPAEDLPDRFGMSPDEILEHREMLSALARAVRSELTEHQHEVFTALLLCDEPVDVLSARLGTTRGAIYKTMFDARRKLRVRLVADGHLRERPPQP